MLRVSVGQSAKTDSSGNYRIIDVRAGNITVSEIKRSYETQTTLAIISGGEIKKMNFALIH